MDFCSNEEFRAWFTRGNDALSKPLFIPVNLRTIQMGEAVLDGGCDDLRAVFAVESGSGAKTQPRDGIAIVELHAGDRHRRQRVAPRRSGER